jgi:hypothetical protein
MKYQLITPTVILKVEVEELKKMVAAKEQKLNYDKWNKSTCFLLSCVYNYLII